MEFFISSFLKPGREVDIQLRGPFPVAVYSSIVEPDRTRQDVDILAEEVIHPDSAASAASQYRRVSYIPAYVQSPQPARQ